MTRHTDDATTRRRDETNRRETSRRTMGEVSHTNPATGESFGDSQVFQRGTIAMVDGGEADSRPDDEEDESAAEPMGDVDHTPREDAPEANDAYVRGVDREGESDDESETAADTEEGADEEPV